MLLIGLLCGAPFGRAINRQAPAHIVNAWRVAHASLPAGGLLMLVVGAVLTPLAGGDAVKWLIALSLIVSSYAFCVSLPLAAIVGQRGLTPDGPWSGKLVYAGNLLGAATSLLAVFALIYAAFVSL
ncbi:hypothetical protein HLB44_17350 [Aquincola sp. S2]|uniref:DUF350 domain-containing protein n=1 Tax=Pseudaquabacterium terrae TaxID=2732868 RepID=A0ABX2EJK0_9BURK|nr:hypothetical protein [Aquabacterium terrae]NRF68761.1 hypothetical protein [Aquabacterium terrae]